MTDISITKEKSGTFVALCFCGSRVFRQYGWTAEEAERKVVSDMLRFGEKVTHANGNTIWQQP